MKNKHISWFLVGLIVFIFISNLIAMRYHLYWKIWWFDIPMHFFGGFFLGLGALWLYYLSGRFSVIPEKHRNPMYVVTLVLVSVIVFGSLWEAYEFGLDAFVRLVEVYDMKDTIKDIIMGVLGALVSSVYFIKKGHYRIEENNNYE